MLISLSCVSSESQYKYHIRKWKSKKNTSISKKVAIYQVVQKRARLGKSSATMREGQDFGTSNLRRYLKTEKRRAITLLPSAGEGSISASIFYGRVAGSRM